MSTEEARISWAITMARRERRRRDLVRELAQRSISRDRGLDVRAFDTIDGEGWGLGEAFPRDDLTRPALFAGEERSEPNL